MDITTSELGTGTPKQEGHSNHTSTITPQHVTPHCEHGIQAKNPPTTTQRDADPLQLAAPNSEGKIRHKQRTYTEKM